MARNIGQVPVLILCVFVFGFHKSNCFDYCTIKCSRVGATHTMCKYSGGPASACDQYDKSKSTMTQAEKKAILDSHNKLRSKVAEGKQAGQPSAANMMELIWDSEVEEIAQRWAYQCQFDHDKCRNTKDGKEGGQNIAISGSASTPNTDHVDNWYSEVKDFPMEMLGSFVPQGGPMIGHYTQVVWAETRKIGCAKSVYSYAAYAKSGQGLSVLFVCDYSPAGNFNQHSVYIVGDACSKCPNDFKCSTKYPGLCENPDKSTFGSSARVKLNTGLMISFILLTGLYNY